MFHQESIYRLENLIEFYDTCVSGKRADKKDRSAKEKRPVLVAVESRNKRTDFVAMQAVDTVSTATVRSLSFPL